MSDKINDEFTDLPVSRQRKWQLRNPDKQKVLFKRYRSSDKGKANSQRGYAKWIAKHPTYRSDYYWAHKKSKEDNDE